TSPSACSSAIVAAIDCGRTRSAVASALVVRGPSRWSRASTAPWEIGNEFSTRSRRTSWPSTIRSSLDERRRSTFLVPTCDYTGNLYSLPVDSPDRYKWIALSNTTLAVMLATIDASIMLIAMPEIFRGIHLDPLEPGNSFYLLWMILGFLVV